MDRDIDKIDDAAIKLVNKQIIAHMSVAQARGEMLFRVWTHVTGWLAHWQPQRKEDMYRTIDESFPPEDERQRRVEHYRQYDAMLAAARKKREIEE